jgi:hypothetical protein
MMKNMCGVHKLAWLLVIVGALNWGLVGLGGYFGGNWNVVNLIFGSWDWLEWLIYVLVGVSALLMLMKGSCKKCMTGKKM